MDSYRTEEEQVEALKRWWEENGRSIVIAVVVALAASFGWQGWQANRAAKADQASDLYQQLLEAVMSQQAAVNAAPEGEDAQLVLGIGEQLKTEFKSTTYAQFAALHLAALAVGRDDLADAENQLRWVLGRAAAGSDTASIAQLRLARVVAAAGDTEQALTLLGQDGGSYATAYAAARGDVLLAAGRRDEALAAYNEAAALAASGTAPFNTAALQQKLQALSPVPSRELDAAPVAAVPETVTVEDENEVPAASDVVPEE